MDILGDAANTAELASRIPEPDRALYRDFKALAIHAAFDDRVFIVYKPQGLTAEGQHRPPQVVARLRCMGFAATSRNGAEVQIENLETGDVAYVGYIPSRVFGLDVFMAVPPNMRLKWDVHARRGAMIRSMSYALLIKTRSRSDWYSANVDMCETPNKLKELYSDVVL